LEVTVRVPFEHNGQNATAGQQLTVTDFDGDWLVAHGLAEAVPAEKPAKKGRDSAGD